MAEPVILEAVRTPFCAFPQECTGAPDRGACVRLGDRLCRVSCP
jgi:hypothetical protein